jgi:hypothetical protein
LHYVHRHNIELYRQTQDKVLEFFSELKAARITSGFFSDQFLKKNKLMVCFTYFLKFVLLLPIYAVGLVTNYLPYILPSRIFRILKIDIEYKTAVQMISGMITFPAFYALLIWFFMRYVSTEFSSALIILAVLPVLGYVTMFYWTETQRFARVVRFYFFMSDDKKREMIDLRNEILDKMEEARKSLVEQPALNS